MLEFIEETHTYLLDGVRIPSVTDCTDLLNDYSAVPVQVMKAAAEFGQHVHAATELWDQGNLDEGALDPALVPWLAGWKKFVAESGFDVLAVEERVYSAKYRYAGTLDRRGILNGKPVIIDIKTPTVVPASAGPQTAGYQQAIEEMHGKKIKGRYAVQLKGDGTYRLYHYADKNDFNTFVSCLNVINWRNDHGK